MSVSGIERVDPKVEYQTLREELLQSRRYVFERPLLIVALAVAAMSDRASALLPALPPLMSGLLLFNFWFTVNRLLSSSRIVAYIQLALEEGSCGPWRGWETSLRHYRMWHKKDLAKKQRMVDEEIDHDAVPDALMYYPPIFQLHVSLIVLAAIGSIAASVVRPGRISIACLAVTVILVLAFARYCLNWRPSKVRTLIERNRVIRGHVLRSMQQAPEGGGPPNEGMHPAAAKGAAAGDAY